MSPNEISRCLPGAKAPALDKRFKLGATFQLCAYVPGRQYECEGTTYAAVYPMVTFCCGLFLARSFCHRGEVRFQVLRSPLRVAHLKTLLTPSDERPTPAHVHGHVNLNQPNGGNQTINLSYNLKPTFIFISLENTPQNAIKVEIIIFGFIFYRTILRRPILRRTILRRPILRLTILIRHIFSRLILCRSI